MLVARTGTGNTNMNIHFQAPDVDHMMEGVGRVLFWGIVGAVQMKYTKEKLREKEVGLDVDERAEWEAEQRARGSFYEDEEETYVCALCENESEVRLTACSLP